MFKLSFSPSFSLKYIFFFSILLIACNSSDSQEKESDEVKVEESNEEVNKNTTVTNAEQLVEQKDRSKLNAAQLQVQTLLKSCVNNDYEAAAKTIMYRGKDQNRVGVDSFDNSNKSEANTVKITCEVIKGWLGESKDYEFISYQEVETDLGPQHVVEIMFKKEKIGVNRHFFYLIDTPKGMLLVDML